MKLDEKVRARVLEVNDHVATLGVYVQGAWCRIYARTEVPLTQGAWLQGRLEAPPDGSMVFFRVLGEDQALAPEENHQSGPGLDLEA